MRTSIIMVFLLYSVSFCCMAKTIEKEVTLGEYTVLIKVPQDFSMLESPYEEGKYIHFFSPSGSSVFLFIGGLVRLPLVAREKAVIRRIEKNRKTFTEFGTRDSIFFRETVFRKTKIRAGYDNVQFGEVSKFDKIVNSIKIRKLIPQKTESECLSLEQ